MLLIMLLIDKWTYCSNETILGIKLLNKDPPKIIVFTKKGNLLILSNDGNLILSEKITENKPIWKIKLFDIDNDGKLEIIFACMDGILRVYKLKDPLMLEFYWSHKFSSSISGILTNDINNNGYSEVIAYSLDKSLRILDPKNGNLIWGQVFSDGIEDAIILGANNSKSLQQIIACGNDGTIRSFSSNNGDLLWFKRFSNKVRFINYINSKKGILIVCGGDDKQLHFIDNQSHNEIASLEFDDYVWKCISFPSLVNNAILVSSYSFDYLEQSKPLQNIVFTSKLLYIDQNLETIWELPNKNIEVIHRFRAKTHRLIAIGTTQGEFLILDEKSGTIKYSINHNSCVNAIQYEPITKTFIICYEDGLINALHITNN